MNISNFIEEYKISTKLCDDIKNYYKNNKEYKEKRNDILNSFNVYFFNSSTEECIVSFFNELNSVNLRVSSSKLLNVLSSMLKNII